MRLVSSGNHINTDNGCKYVILKGFHEKNHQNIIISGEKHEYN